MSKERTRLLMEKELDGELTPTEKDELERLLRADAEAAKEREAWRRFNRALVADLERAPKLDVTKLTARVLEGAAAKPRTEAVVYETPRRSLRTAALGAA